MITNNRIKYISHKGRQILYVDYSHLLLNKPELKAEFLNVVKDLLELCKTIKDTTLFLTDVTGSTADKEMMKALQDGASFIKTLNIVEKECIVGIEGIKRALLNMVNFFSKTNIIAFDTLDEAKDWLVEK